MLWCSVFSDGGSKYSDSAEASGGDIMMVAAAPPPQTEFILHKLQYKCLQRFFNRRYSSDAISANDHHFYSPAKKSKNAFKEATIVGTEMPSWILKGFLWKKALNHYYRIWNKKELEFCNCYCKNWQNRFGEKGLKCVVAPRRSFFPLQFWNAIPLIHWFSAFTDFHQGNFEKDKEIPKKISHIFYFKSIQIQIRIYQKYSHYIRS